MPLMPPSEKKGSALRHVLLCVLGAAGRACSWQLRWSSVAADIAPSSALDKVANSPAVCVSVTSTHMPTPSLCSRSEFLDQQKPLHHLATKWACGLPRGLQAVVAAGPAALPAGKPREAAAVVFGEQRLRAGWGPRPLVQAMLAAYRPHLEALRGSPFGSPQQAHSGASVAPQRSEAGSNERPSPGWQQRGQHLQQWQQEGRGQGGLPGDCGEAAAAAVPAFPGGSQQDQALAPTPLMEWAGQPAPAQPLAQHAHQQQPQQQQQQAGTMPTMHHQQQQDQWQPPVGALPPQQHHWHPQQGPPVPQWQPWQPHPRMQPQPPYAACQTMPWGWPPQQHWPGSVPAPQPGMWAQQPVPYGQGFCQPGGAPQHAAAGHPQWQHQGWDQPVQHHQPWAPPAQHAAPPHPEQLLEQQGQGAKRGMPAAPAGAAGGTEQDQPGGRA